MIVHSFSFKSGLIVGGGRVVDCRVLRNPHGLARLRDLDGRHPDVQAFVERDPRYSQLLSLGLLEAAGGRDVSFGCHGGRHRSVAMAERLAVALALVGVCATVKHHCL